MGGEKGILVKLSNPYHRFWHMTDIWIMILNGGFPPIIMLIYTNLLPFNKATIFDTSPNIAECYQM